MGEALVRVGHIQGAHGLKGHLLAFLPSREADWSGNLKQVHLKKRESSQEFLKFSVLEFKPHGEKFRLLLEGIRDRNEAESLKSYELWIDGELLKSQPGERIYLREILGFEVWQEGDLLGVIHDFSSNGAQDLVEVLKENRSFLAPFIDEFVSRIDFESKKVFVEFPEGLRDFSEKKPGQSDDAT